MKNDLEIRTNDTLLKAAITCWWQEYAKKCPEGRFLLTDLDSYPLANLPGELTLSRKQPADLHRPFSFEELEALLRTKPKEGKRLVIRENIFYLDGEPLALSPLEQKLLTVLFENTEPISAEELSIALWGECRPSNQINVYIRYLRKKTDLPERPRLILTAHRKGFYLNND